MANGESSKRKANGFPNKNALTTLDTYFLKKSGKLMYLTHLMYTIL
jgi:hypothetical protein